MNKPANQAHNASVVAIQMSSITMFTRSPRSQNCIAYTLPIITFAVDLVVQSWRFYFFEIHNEKLRTEIQNPQCNVTPHASTVPHSEQYPFEWRQLNWQHSFLFQVPFKCVSEKRCKIGQYFANEIMGAPAHKEITPNSFALNLRLRCVA